MWKFAIIAAVLLAFLLLLNVAASVWWDRNIRQPNPPDSALPMLVRNLPTEVSKKTPAFQQRVRARFPDGTKSSLLTTTLRSEGFHVRHIPENNLQSATLEQNDAVCGSGWTIFWNTDPQGLARNIGANVNVGCL